MKAQNTQRKCILFVRVSTLQQSYTEQAKQLAIYAQSKGFSTDNQIIIANKESATKLSFEEREGLKDLYDRINKDESIKAVFVAEVSRIARREDVIFKFKSTLIERKINLYVQHDNMQLFNDDGTINTGAEIMFSILSTLAKQEMIDKRERFKKGKLRAIAEGKVQSGKALFGYRKSENKTVQIDPEQAEIVRRIYSSYLSGKSMLDIYNELQQESKMPVRTDKNLKKRIIHQILSNQSYCGRCREGKRVQYKNRTRLNNSSATQYPAIIEPEVFDEVQRMKAERQNKAKDNTKNIYFAKKIIRYRINETKTEAMVPRRTTVCYASETRSATVSINLIDSILWDEARAEYIFGKNNRAEQTKRIIKRYESEIEEAEKAIKEAEQEQERLNYLFTKGRKTIEQYNKEYERAESKKNELKKQTNDLKMKISQIEVNDSATLRTFNNLDSELDDKAKQDIIREYIENVFVKRVDESVTEHMHYEIEVVTKTDLHNIYKYYPKQREIMLPEHDAQLYKDKANPASFASVQEMKEAAAVLGITKQTESVLSKLYKRVKTKDYVNIRYTRKR